MNYVKQSLKTLFLLFALCVNAHYAHSASASAQAIQIVYPQESIVLLPSKKNSFLLSGQAEKAIYINFISNGSVLKKTLLISKNGQKYIKTNALKTLSIGDKSVSNKISLEVVY